MLYIGYMTCVYEKNVKGENYKKKITISHQYTIQRQCNIIRSLKSRYGCNWTSPRRRYRLAVVRGGKGIRSK